jgi:hypothetical protein
VDIYRNNEQSKTKNEGIRSVMEGRKLKKKKKLVRRRKTSFYTEGNINK